MSNHYHLEIEAPQGNISRVMQWISTTYTVNVTGTIAGLAIFSRDVKFNFDWKRDPPFGVNTIHPSQSSGRWSRRKSGGILLEQLSRLHRVQEEVGLAWDGMDFETIWKHRQKRASGISPIRTRRSEKRHGKPDETSHYRNSFGKREFCRPGARGILRRKWRHAFMRDLESMSKDVSGAAHWVGEWTYASIRGVDSSVRASR